MYLQSAFTNSKPIVKISVVLNYSFFQVPLSTEKAPSFLPILALEFLVPADSR
jgi:hypothetical protein